MSFKYLVLAMFCVTNLAFADAPASKTTATPGVGENTPAQEAAKQIPCKTSDTTLSKTGQSGTTTEKTGTGGSSASQDGKAP